MFKLIALALLSLAAFAPSVEARAPRLALPFRAVAVRAPFVNVQIGRTAFGAFNRPLLRAEVRAEARVLAARNLVGFRSFNAYRFGFGSYGLGFGLGVPVYSAPVAAYAPPVAVAVQAPAVAVEAPQPMALAPASAVTYAAPTYAVPLLYAAPAPVYYSVPVTYGVGFHSYGFGFRSFGFRSGFYR